MLLFLGNAQPGQGGRAGTALAFVGTWVGETGEDPLGLLELAQRRETTRRRGGITGSQPVDELAG